MGTNHVFICGFGTFRGHVTAAKEWGEPCQAFTLSEAEERSHSHVFHSALPMLRSKEGDEALNAFVLVLRSESDDEKQQQGGAVGEAIAARKALAASAFGPARRQRAVGVRYVKETESRSHYYDASLTMQVDAWIHVDESSALAPLP